MSGGLVPDLRGTHYDREPLTMPTAGPTEADGDRLAAVIRNEVGRTFWATGGQEVSGDQAFAQVMARAGARRR